MIRLERIEDVIKFTFNDNPLYLNNGTIEVPVNSLSLLIDESNIATFKKGNNDAFLSCSLDELGMTKEQLITWYKDNMVDEGITPEEVEDIVESATTNLFGYAEYDTNTQRINFKHDSSGSVISSIDAEEIVELATTNLFGYAEYDTNTQRINFKHDSSGSVISSIDAEEIVELATTNLFGYAEYDSNSQRINFKHDSSGSVISSIDASDFIIDGMVSNVEIVTISDVKYLKITFNTDSGKEPILIPLADIFNPNLYYTKAEIDEALSEIDEALSGKVDSDVFDEKERVISIALNDLDENKLDVSAYTPTDLSNYYTKSETSGATEISTALDAKQNTLVSGTNIKTINNTSILGSGNIDIQGGGVNVVQTTGSSTTDVMSQNAVTSEITNAVYSLVYELNFKLGYEDITTSITSSSTDTQVPSAKAVNDKLGGLSLVKLTQAEYDALVTKDSNTLYVIIN